MTEKVMTDLSLGSQTGTWNEVGSIDANAEIVTFAGTVMDKDGTPISVNVNPLVKIRVQNGKIFELHSEAVHNQAKLALKVEYVLKKQIPIASHP
jgi:hypothetical protein